jgi:hypothetical protein
MGLDWSKCLPYKTGKLGGWVSKNYLAAARLISWFYRPILESIDVINQYEEPKKPLQTWTRMECYQ